MLAKLFIRPEIAQDLKTRSSRFVVIIRRRQDNADNVITIRRTRQTEHATIDARGSRYLTLLPKVNVLFGRGEPSRAARLHFYKAESRTVVSDKINLRMDERAAKRATDGQSEVGGN